MLEDDTFLFHGTSNLSEKSLDNGITNSHIAIPIEIIGKIISIYEEMTWFGNHVGGYGVLRTYSVADRIDNKKYFFLGETPGRFSLYSSSDFAGGELVRSVYYSLKDLEEYLTNSSFHEKHKSALERDIRLYGKKCNVDFRRLENHVNTFESILLDLYALRKCYKYGLIYCYKIEKSDYGYLFHRWDMGIRVNEALPLERLKAKLIFDDPVENYFENSFNDALRLERSLLWSKRLRKS